MEHDGLLFLSFALLGVLQVFFLSEGAALLDVVDQSAKASLDAVLDLLLLEGLHLLVVLPLRAHEVLDWDLGEFRDGEGGLALHLEEQLVDFHVLWQEIGPSEDELLGEVFRRAMAAQAQE